MIRGKDFLESEKNPLKRCV